VTDCVNTGNTEEVKHTMLQV